jgi:hypothetical protein
MTGNERIVHPVPRIFLLALLGIAAAIILTVAQVSILRAMTIPTSNLSTELQSTTGSESSYSDSAARVESILSESNGQLPISVRLTLLAMNMALVCTIVAVITLWSPHLMRRFIFGRGFGGSQKPHAPKQYNPRRERVPSTAIVPGLVAQPAYYRSSYRNSNRSTQRIGH